MSYHVSCPKYKVGFFGGKFLPFHKGHLDTIIRCASECKKLYVILMHHGLDEIKILNEDIRFPKELLSPHVRELALNAELSKLPNVEVISYDCRPADNRAIDENVHLWTYECQDMIELIGKFDVAYSSEVEYSKEFAKFYPWADAIVIDAARSRFSISATKIRSMPFYQAYSWLPREYQKLINKKILITGTESCGKSCLVQKLASILNTSHTSEFGRQISEKYKLSSPGIEHYRSFVYAQKELERQSVETANMVAICDSDAITTAFYSDEYENTYLEVAYEAAKNDHYDLVFFIEPTVPWVNDGFRTHSAESERLRQADKMKKMYADVGYDLITLSGNYKDTYEVALAHIENLLEMK